VENLALISEKKQTFNPENLLSNNSSGAGSNLEKSVGYQELNLLSKLLLTNDPTEQTKSKNLVLLDLFPNEDLEYSSQ
jgi:hypothetical protein